MNMIPFGTSRDGFPMFQIGNVIGRNGTEYSVVVNLSRKNSMGKVGGWHLALTTEDSMGWQEAAEMGIYGETLALHFRTHATPVWFREILPHLTDEELGKLVFATSSNSEGTAQRPDVHAHVMVALDWTDVRRMVDDARKPEIIIAEAVEAAIAEREQESARALMALEHVALATDLVPSSNDNVLDTGYPG